MKEKKLFYHVLFTFCESMFQSGECKFARRMGTMLYQPRSKGFACYRHRRRNGGRGKGEVPLAELLRERKLPLS